MRYQSIDTHRSFRLSGDQVLTHHIFARGQGDMVIATDGTLSLDLNASLNAVFTIRVELDEWSL